MVGILRGNKVDSLLNGKGFLGTQAPFYADITLLLILLTFVLLTIGWRLAVQKRYEAHRWVQTAAVILNTLVVLVIMVNSFITHILPGIPTKLNQGDYAVTTLHAVIGTFSLLLGVFVVLRGNQLVPKFLLFRSYKFFMRTAYAAYSFATLLGIIVYLLVYVFGI
jgi:uncharacterized membrane protein YozB (DUF420 family)